jgi:hypothetical protein
LQIPQEKCRQNCRVAIIPENDKKVMASLFLFIAFMIVGGCGKVMDF